MATDAVSWVMCTLIGFLLYADPIPRTSGWTMHTENSSHRIQIVDNDPEFLVGAKGIEKPFCFHLESPENDVIRLLQDNVSGIVVNAKVFHDSRSNKSYLGSIFISAESLKILATQEDVLVDRTKYQWLGMRLLDEFGHRVIVGANMVVVTFRGKNITLIIRRHFVFLKDNANIGGDGRKEGEEEDGSGVMVGKESEEEEEGEGGGGGDGGDDNIVSLHDADANIKLSDQPSEKHRRNRKGKHSSRHFRSHHLPVVSDAQTHSSDSKREGNRGYRFHERRNSRNKLRVKKSRRSQFRADGDSGLSGIVPSDQDRNLVDVSQPLERRRGSAYLGMYITDSTDFSNNTHGLLGQFLYKKVEMEKVRYKQGRMKAVFRVEQGEERLAKAVLSLRRNVALNITRACWRVRHQGRDLIDGTYRNYVIPNLRFTLMMKLPPHSPL